MTNYVILTSELKTGSGRGPGRFVDSRWFSFLSECGLSPLILGDIENDIDSSFLLNDRVKGCLLIGGGNVSGPYDDVLYSNEVFESLDDNRERLERSLIERSLAISKPIVGVCRGMQAIGCYFGAKLHRISEHAGVRHYLTSVSDSELQPLLNEEVNSYHDYAFLAHQLPSNLVAIAQVGDIVEVFRHSDFPVYGLMWHPEREVNFSDTDINFFRRCFKI